MRVEWAISGTLVRGGGRGGELSGRTGGGEEVQIRRVRDSVQRCMTCEEVQRGFAGPISYYKTGSSMI